MLKENEIKIKIRNFHSEIASEIFRDILMDVDHNLIKATQTRINKAQNCLNISILLSFLGPFACNIVDIAKDQFYSKWRSKNNINNGSKEHINELKSAVNRAMLELGSSPEEISQINEEVSNINRTFDKIANHTVNNYNANAIIEVRECKIFIKHGEAEKKASKIPSPDLSVSNDTEETETKKDDNIMTKICPTCRTENREGAHYCDYCGAKLE